MTLISLLSIREAHLDVTRGAYQSSSFSHRNLSGYYTRCISALFSLFTSAMSTEVAALEGDVKEFKLQVRSFVRHLCFGVCC